MKKEIIITDFSKMPEGVCVFGYDKEGNGIRPVIFNIGEEAKGLPEDYLRGIEPFMRVEFEFIKPQPSPPHTEDWLINKDYKPKITRTLSENEGKEFLEKILNISVKDIFGVGVNKTNNLGAYIEPGKGEKSIGTIKARNIEFVKHYFSEEKNRYQYRIKFLDNTKEIYDLSVTDCLFRKYCDNAREEGRSYGFIGAELQRRLSQAILYFRIGAGRPWGSLGYPEGKCWLFFTGVYSFPDYKK